MTTAITRPEIHNECIKYFYDTYYCPYHEYINSKFEVIHIINIDSPEKLKSHFTLDQTIKNFDSIIPSDVRKIYIPTETPAFLQAFKNIVNKIKSENLTDDKNIFWWFEDDWKLTNTKINFFKESYELISMGQSTSMTMTANTPMGSFRGGPIMSGYYFNNYFNVEGMGIMNNTCDPEKQVGRFITAKKRTVMSKKLSIVRTMTHKESLNLVVYSTNDDPLTYDDFLVYFYKVAFNENIKIHHHFLSKVSGSDGIYKYTNCDAGQELILNYDDVCNEINRYTNTYFIVKPYNFTDFGRKFAKTYDLQKWMKISDITTYK